jgi:hypothetical protein
MLSSEHFYREMVPETFTNLLRIFGVLYIETQMKALHLETRLTGKLQMGRFCYLK